MATAKTEYVQNNTEELPEPREYLELSEQGGEESDSNWEDMEEEEESGNEDAAELYRRFSAETRQKDRTIDDENLPSTVSLLHGHNGEKIYLIGTAHFSKESCEDVRKIISEAQPDVVMIELCRGRVEMLLHDEETLLKLAGDMSYDKIAKYIKEKGVISGIMTFLLLHMSAHITKQLGMAPGGEFRAAFQESRKVPGCRLVFGDRAVEVTLQRAFSTFSVWQKMKFALSVMKDLGPIKPEDIEKLKEKDMLEQALSEMMGEYPEMTSVFLTERDMYLANSLQFAAATNSLSESPAVIVGVVGLGHAAGIKEQFYKEITKEQMDELIRIPTKSKLGKVVKTIFTLTFIASVGYGVYRLLNWTGLGETLQVWGKV